MSFIKNLIHNHDIQNNDQLHTFIKHQKLSQVDEIKKFIDNKCESIVERSLDWGDSSYGEELMEVNQPLFELKAILEEVE